MLRAGNLLPTCYIPKNSIRQCFALFDTRLLCLLASPHTFNALSCVNTSFPPSHHPLPLPLPLSRTHAGVDTFDLSRLEAAVSAIPDTAYEGEQAALTQVSQSMLLRCVWVASVCTAHRAFVSE
jgi:hypothetical protein